ncbi:hypothetical protein [Sporosarcina koreensis]|uniref:Uncharacterized protein n=1 Tax=Sporosarcina koreensis TaxID=334735 RepID=A0ABW0U0F6_9BACL
MDNRLSKILQEHMRDMAKIGTMATEYTSALARIGNAAAERYAKLNKAFQPYLDLTQFTQSFANIQSGILKTEEDIKVFKVAIVELGYPPHDGMAIGNMRAIAELYLDDKKELEDNIDEIMTHLYNASELKEILLFWEETKLVKKRLPLLRNAIMAHNLGMYDLVVPSIISQMEGLLVDTFHVKGRVDGTIQKVMLKNLLLKDESISSFSFDETIHEYFSDNVLASFEHGKQLGTDLSRHAILHGSDTGFGKRTVSLKAILLFDYLVSASIKVKDDVIQECKREIAGIRRRKRKY